MNVNACPAVCVVQTCLPKRQCPNTHVTKSLVVEEVGGSGVGAKGEGVWGWAAGVGGKVGWGLRKAWHGQMKTEGGNSGWGVGWGYCTVSTTWRVPRPAYEEGRLQCAGKWHRQHSKAQEEGLSVMPGEYRPRRSRRHAMTECAKDNTHSTPACVCLMARHVWENACNNNHHALVTVAMLSILFKSAYVTRVIDLCNVHMLYACKFYKQRETSCSKCVACLGDVPERCRVLHVYLPGACHGPKAKKQNECSHAAMPQECPCTQSKIGASSPSSSSTGTALQKKVGRQKVLPATSCKQTACCLSCPPSKPQNAPWSFSHTMHTEIVEKVGSKGEERGMGWLARACSGNEPAAQRGREGEQQARGNGERKWQRTREQTEKGNGEAPGQVVYPGENMR